MYFKYYFEKIFFCIFKKSKAHNVPVLGKADLFSGSRLQYMGRPTVQNGKYYGSLDNIWRLPFTANY